MYDFLILRSKNLKTKKLRNIDSKIQQKPLPHGRGFFLALQIQLTTPNDVPSAVNAAIITWTMSFTISFLLMD